MYWLFILSCICLSLPLFIVISFFVVISSGSPVLFSQKRIGKNGKPFIMYKFRTMHRGAEAKQKQYWSRNEADGPVFKIYDDPRFTPIGKFLSHTGLDELPQLWNVLQGDMALFGPRPLPIYEEKRLLPWQKKRYLIKPGILSPWVLQGYHKRTFTEWMRYDIAYVHEKSFWYDLKFFYRSVIFMVQLFIAEVKKRV